MKNNFCCKLKIGHFQILETTPKGINNKIKYLKWIAMKILRPQWRNGHMKENSIKFRSFSW